MKTFNSVPLLLAAAAICSAPGPAAAAKFDGSAAMMCATVLVHECAASAHVPDARGGEREHADAVSRRRERHAHP